MATHSSFGGIVHYRIGSQQVRVVHGVSTYWPEHDVQQEHQAIVDSLTIDEAQKFAEVQKLYTQRARVLARLTQSVTGVTAPPEIFRLWLHRAKEREGSTELAVHSYNSDGRAWVKIDTYSLRFKSVPLLVHAALHEFVHLCSFHEVQQSYYTYESGLIESRTIFTTGCDINTAVYYRVENITPDHWRKLKEVLEFFAKAGSVSGGYRAPRTVVALVEALVGKWGVARAAQQGLRMIGNAGGKIYSKRTFTASVVKRPFGELNETLTEIVARHGGMRSMTSPTTQEVSTFDSWRIYPEYLGIKRLMAFSLLVKGETARVHFLEDVMTTLTTCRVAALQQRLSIEGYQMSFEEAQQGSFARLAGCVSRVEQTQETAADLRADELSDTFGDFLAKASELFERFFK